MSPEGFHSCAYINIRKKGENSELPTGTQGLLQYVVYCNKFLYCHHKRLTAGMENPSRFADNLSSHLSVLSRHLDIFSRENINVRIQKRLFYSVEYYFNNQINSETIHICSYSSYGKLCMTLLSLDNEREVKNTDGWNTIGRRTIYYARPLQKL